MGDCQSPPCFVGSHFRAPVLSCCTDSYKSLNCYPIPEPHPKRECRHVSCGFTTGVPIDAPEALYIRAKADQLMHLHIGEYTALTAMADLSGHYGVGALLETCLADYLTFVERTRRRIRNIVESEIGGKMRKAA